MNASPVSTVAGWGIGASNAVRAAAKLATLCAEFTKP